MTRVSSPVRWRLGAVLEVIEETPHAKTVVLEVPDWPGHVAGQHVDIRLTAEDGYQTERSYSIASPPEQSTVELTVERIDDGEVSPYLTDELRVGEELELRGPIGGYFNWRRQDGGPLLLIAGGSGLVPLMAMLRHRAATCEHRRRATAPVGPLARGRAISRRARAARSRRRPRRALHAHARTAPGLGGICAADRRGDVDHRRTGSGARAADLRVRADRVRRACRRTSSWHWATRRRRSAPSDSARQAEFLAFARGRTPWAAGIPSLFINGKRHHCADAVGSASAAAAVRAAPSRPGPAHRAARGSAGWRESPRQEREDWVTTVRAALSAGPGNARDVVLRFRITHRPQGATPSSDWPIGGRDRDALTAEVPGRSRHPAAHRRTACRHAPADHPPGLIARAYRPVRPSVLRHEGGRRIVTAQELTPRGC